MGDFLTEGIRNGADLSIGSASFGVNYSGETKNAGSDDQRTLSPWRDTMNTIYRAHYSE